MPTEITALEPSKKFRLPTAYLLDRFDSYSVVLDSSIVVEDIRWKVMKRRNPAIRSLLDRALDSTLLIPFVPDILLQQVEENLNELSARHGIPAQRFFEEWEKLKPCLQLVPIADGDLEAVEIRDVTDAPFVAAQRQTNACSIISNDNDFHASDAPSTGRVALEQTTVLQGALLASLGATFMFGFIALSPLLLLAAVVWGIYALAKRRPGLALVLLGITALLTYFFWDRIKAAFKKLFSEENKAFLFEFMGIWAAAANDHRKKAEEAQAALEATLSVPPKPSATQQ